MIYDQEKNASNIRKHSISFEEIEFLDWRDALITRDERYDYGETRYIGYAFLGSRLHCLVWTEREGDMRPISFRKANKREIRDYEKEQDA